MKKILALVLTILLICSVFSLTAIAVEDEMLINTDGNYVIDETIASPIVISNTTGTVTLSNANIQSTGRSAIKVQDNSNIIFELVGFNNIAGDLNAYSCGIEVEYGSSVIFKGEGVLNVTGGKWGAAIGSYGTDINIPEADRVKVGEITIDGGNINAYAGPRGAGIGAGYHVNGNKIVINGGTVFAYGNECGAGIGCGYGTSGGAIGVAAVGEYDAGTILITGGEVYAATQWNQNFNCDTLEEFNANDPGTFAAGIGGGYGASASNIQITGGKVVAIGSCGGAGIGGGRGTSKAAKYNQEAYKVNITISGDADVVAISATSRSNEINSGGAAIGSGRGTHYGGNITITDTATVKAISATQAPAIGASKQSSPVDGAIPAAESIVIDDEVDLYALSAGEYAIDTAAENLSISPEYFGSTDKWFFNENSVSIVDIDNVKVESPKGEKIYTALAGSVSLWARITSPQAESLRTGLKIIVPLAMAVRFETGEVYYNNDTVEVEYDKPYHFQMCCVDWSTRVEKKIHKPYEVFTPEHGIYADEGIGLAGTVVYTVIVSKTAIEQAYEESTKTFIIPKRDKVLRTDTNKCFMAYRFWFKGDQYNKQTGIDNVVYDDGVEHINTLEDFQYHKPLESLSVNLPLGTTITAKAYKNYEYINQVEIFITIDEENPDLCYKDYYWEF